MNDSAAAPGPAAGVDPLTVFDPARREPDLRSMTRIVLQPIGSPMPLGFFTVAIDSVLVSALQWGLLPAADGRAVALIVFPAFVVQVIVGIFAFRARDSIAATLMMSFATTWLVDALIFYVNPVGAADALGIFFVVFAVFAAFMPASALPKRALAAVLAVAVPRFLIAGIADLAGNQTLAGRCRAGLPADRGGAVHGVRAAVGRHSRTRGTADRAARHGPPRHPSHAAARHRAAGRRPPNPLTALPAASATANRLARAAKGASSDRSGQRSHRLPGAG
jgi:succinate-acetate transporter protein